MKNILITGANGLLGQNLQIILEPNYNLTLTDIHPQSFRPVHLENVNYFPCDITQSQTIEKLIKNKALDIVIHTAAMTDVDGCEKNPGLAEKIHIDGTKNIAKACSKNTRFVFISTDYVFDGKNGPYYENDTPNPISIYGDTKLKAEHIIQKLLKDFLILRTTVMYGVGINLRPYFPDWVISKLSANEAIHVADDQSSNTTLASNLAWNCELLIKKASSGIYHIAGNEIVSRFKFAQQIAECFSIKKELIFPCKTEEIKQKAPRPRKSGFLLDKIRAFPEIRLMNVSEQLKQYTKERMHV